MTPDLAVVDATVITMDAEGTVHDRANIVVDGGVITAVDTDLAPARRPSGDRRSRRHRRPRPRQRPHAHGDDDVPRPRRRRRPRRLPRPAAARGRRRAVRGDRRRRDGAGRRRMPARRHHDGPRHVLLPGDLGERRRDGRLRPARRAGLRRVRRRRPAALRRASGVGGRAARPPRRPERRWVCPHSTYLLDEQQLAAVGALAAEHGARVHVHACETAAELAAVRQRHGTVTDRSAAGRRPARRRPRSLAHGVHLDDDDLAMVAASGAAVAHCPASNQKLGSGFARIPELLAAGVPVALGTDGAASANDLDPWLAMRLAVVPTRRPLRSGHDRCGDGPGDGDHRWCPRRSATRRSARSRWARAPTSSCSTRRRRRWHPCTTPSRRPSTQRVAATCAGSSPAGRSSSTIGN